jgi:lactate permease
MNTLLAATPILIILLLMTLFRWSMIKAGLTSYIICVLVGLFAFGLNQQVFLISQFKAVILFGFILAVLAPALYLYNYIDQSGGIEALAGYIKERPIQRDMLVLLLAWAFSGFLEGMAGFGLPIAIVAPILLLLGQKPVKAVALVAIGHAWAVTLGDMGTIFQALIGVTKLSPEALVPVVAVLLGLACIVSGLICMAMLGLWRYWLVVLITGFTMSAVQYGLVLIG